MRHGLDDETRIGGWSNVALINEGIAQVKEAKKFIDSNLNFNTIYSSNIRRARQTALIVNAGRNKQIIYTDLLREQNKGNYNGVLKKTLAKDDYYLSCLATYEKYPNGESMIDLYLRIEELIPKLKYWDESLLITHRGVINMIYYIFNNQKPDLNKEKFNVLHASIHELDITKRKIKRIY